MGDYKMMKKKREYLTNLKVKSQKYYDSVTAENQKADDSGVRYSPRDSYSSEKIAKAMKSSSSTGRDKLDAISEYSDSPFVEAMLDIIAEKGVKDSKIYKAAHVDRRLFSKIVSDPGYRPSKDTCIALALALQLGYIDAVRLLARAGYVLSHSIKRDIIIEFFFKEGIYNIDEINVVLSELGQKPLGREMS